MILLGTTPGTIPYDNKWSCLLQLIKPEISCHSDQFNAHTFRGYPLDKTTTSEQIWNQTSQ
jgi:hypothetical protein